jgi:TolB protein
MNANGGQPIQLTNDSTDDVHPSFSPDGKQLVYCSFGAKSGQWELVVIDLDRPASKRFIGYGLFPRWSPTDNRIVFQRARERGTRWFSVWTIEYEGGEGVRPTEIAASSNAAVITPSWSPDGSYLTFCTVADPSADEQTRPGLADVWVIGADGAGRSNLTHGQFTNLQPIWARDGAIYFVSNRSKDGIENIWTLRPDAALGVAGALAGRGGDAGKASASAAAAKPAAHPDDAADPLAPVSSAPAQEPVTHAPDSELSVPPAE